MKKLLVLGVVAALACTSAYAQEKQALTPAPAVAPAQTTGPQITFEETRFDFGTVTEGEKVERVFKFRNTGTEPLILSNVQTTCGCTVPEWPKEPILPGKAGTIKATFNTTGKLGQQNKGITVISNSKEGNNVVYIAGTVKPKSAEGTDPNKQQSHNHAH